MRTSLTQQMQSTLLYIGNASSRLQVASDRASSGKRILRASDDVPGTSRSLSLRSSISTINQFSDNISNGKPMLQAADDAMSNLTSTLLKVQNIAQESINSTTTAESLKANVTALDSILQNVADIANTQFMGQYIFSGTATDTPAVVSQDGLPQPYAWQGNSNQCSIQVQSGVSVKTSISGNSLFNFDGSAGTGTSDLFTAIKNLRDAIDSNDTNAIKGASQDIADNRNNILVCQAQVGTLMQRMDTASTAIDNSKTRLEGLLSETEDIDIAQAIVELKTQQNVYEAALGVSSKILEFSLASTQYMM